MYTGSLRGSYSSDADMTPIAEEVGRRLSSTTNILLSVAIVVFSGFSVAVVLLIRQLRKRDREREASMLSYQNGMNDMNVNGMKRASSPRAAASGYLSEPAKAPQNHDTSSSSFSSIQEHHVSREMVKTPVPPPSGVKSPVVFSKNVRRSSPKPNKKVPTAAAAPTPPTPFKEIPIPPTPSSSASRSNSNNSNKSGCTEDSDESEGWLEREMKAADEASTGLKSSPSEDSSSSSVKSGLSRLSTPHSAFSSLTGASGESGMTTGMLRTDNGSVISRSKAAHFKDVMSLLQRQEQEKEKREGEKKEKVSTYAKTVALLFSS